MDETDKSAVNTNRAKRIRSTVGAVYDLLFTHIFTSTRKRKEVWSVHLRD